MIPLLFSQIAEMIRHVIDRYDKPIPAVLEIPSKDHPYDPSKDSILRRAKVSQYSGIVVLGRFMHISIFATIIFSRVCLMLKTFASTPIDFSVKLSHNYFVQL